VNLPNVSVEEIDRALREEVEHLLTKPSTVGIAIFGSVGRGDYSEGSDIELQIIDSDVPEHKVELTTRYGVPIHKQLQPRIDLEKRAKINWRIKPVFADAWIVVDKDGQLAKLKESDQQAASKGRQPPTEDDISNYRLSLTLRLHDLRRFSEAPEGMPLFCYQAILRAIDFFYAREQRWYPGLKRLDRDLQDNHPTVHQLLSRALETNKDQVKDTIKLVHYVLDALGGEKWDSEAKVGPKPRLKALRDSPPRGGSPQGDRPGHRCRGRRGRR